MLEAICVAAVAVFAVGCRSERPVLEAPVVPQYGQTDFILPEDVCERQVRPPATAETAAKEKHAVTELTKTADTNEANIESRANLSSITPDTPFGRAIEEIRNSTRPPINIIVLWNDLRDKAGIDQQTPIGVDIVHGVSIRKNLEIILEALSTRQTKIDYTVVNGVVVIATKNSLPRQMQIRSYDTTDISSKPADYYTGPSSSGAGGKR